MPVFTILNHGTNYNRNRTGELISDFGRKMKGTEYKQFLILDGPGSASDKADAPRPAGVRTDPSKPPKAYAPRPGTFDPFTKDKLPKKQTPKFSQTPTATLQSIKDLPADLITHIQGEHGKDTAKTAAEIAKIGEKKYLPGVHGIGPAVRLNEHLDGLITGAGWDDNIRHAIATLAEFGDLTGTINMIGWSRGAVNCLRMANWITQFLGTGYQINIFAVDPVAGGDAGTVLEDTFDVPNTVKNYVGIFALHEARGDFAPQDEWRLKPKGDTNILSLQFPGVHNTPVLEGTEVAQVVRHLAYKFLTKHGTEFTEPERSLTSGQLCELYATMRQKHQDYVKMMIPNLAAKAQGGIMERNVQIKERFVGHRFFVNEHHRECLKRAARDIYAYFFTREVPNPLGKETLSYREVEPWGQKFRAFSLTLPITFAVLSKLYPLQRSSGLDGPVRWNVARPGAGIGTVQYVPSPAMDSLF